MNLSQIIKTLVSEIKLTEIQAKIFLHVVINGKMNTSKISNDLKISLEDATQNSKKLVELGGFIDMPNDEFEAMHPRFTAVNLGCMASNSSFGISMNAPRSIKFFELSDALLNEIFKFSDICFADIFPLVTIRRNIFA